MLQNLIEQNKDQITDLLSSKFNLDAQKSNAVTNTIGNVFQQFAGEKLKDGFQLSDLQDLFNPSTGNTGNSVFSTLSELVKSALSKNNPNLGSDLIGQISKGGLDEIIKMISQKGLGDLDLGGLFGSILGGKSGGLGGMLGNLFGK